ncbi:MAG: sialidase family protein [Pseudohongiella sp.]
MITASSSPGKFPALIVTACLLILSAGCSTPADPQTAFRLRSDFGAELNADAGWAAGLNENATVFTDEPFRLRFEVAATDAAVNVEQRYQLQYQRNGGPWQPMPAENFPQPEKVLELDFATSDHADLGADWQFLTGAAASASIGRDEDGSFLQIASGAVDTTALSRHETLWDPVEFAVDIRLPDDAPGGAGIVFAYADPQNYSRVELSTRGTVSIDRIVDGELNRLAEGNTEIATGWAELKVVLQGSQATIEYNDDALVLTADFPAATSLSLTGLYVPADSTAAFANLVLEGMPRSPRISIMASAAFDHGAPTTDLLAGSSTNFSGGSGISFADTTRPWTADTGHSEWEWPLVIRRYADGADTNENGDTYGFRMATEDGEPLASAVQPMVTVAVPTHHLGGVFVETPARVGPFEASNGDLYFLMEPAETDNMLMTVKSADGGQSWQEADGANRPATGDLEGFAAAQSGDRIYMLHQTSDDVWLHAFATSDHATQPDTWLIQDERLASPEEPPTQVADIALRSDGSIVGVYGGPQKIHVRVRSPEGNWSDETVIDADTPPALSGPSVVTGADDVVHLAYTGDDGTAWYRRIDFDDSLTPPVQLSNQLGSDPTDVASILPLVYLPASDTVSIIYRVNSGHLWERRVTPDGELNEAVRVSDHTVVQNAVDADQTGADAIADGDRVQVLFIDEESRHIFHTYADAEGRWQSATLQVEGVNAQWVRGAQLKGTGAERVYGYVYDAGADGGSGKNRYGEVPLADLP